MVRPYELEKAGNFTVSIDSVAKATGNSSSLELTPADFGSLTPSSKELTLSADGLSKVNSVSGLADATAYKYDITFKFTTTSDTVSNKTVLYTSTVSLYKLVSVTKAMLENMIKTTTKLTVQNRSKIDGFTDSFEVDFSKVSYSLTSQKNITINDMGAGMTSPQNNNSTFSPLVSGFAIPTGIFTGYRTYFNTILCDTPTISSSGSRLDLIYKFGLKDGYVLDDNISYITNEGLKVYISFINKSCKWVADSI